MDIGYAGPQGRPTNLARAMSMTRNVATEMSAGAIRWRVADPWALFAGDSMPPRDWALT
jgi:hypothetical protein